MKKLILSAAALLAAFVAPVRAEAPQTDAETAPRSEWLAPFTAVEVAAEADVVFIRVPDTEAPRVVYDTKGLDNARFRAVVRNRKLSISERTGLRRAERTSVRVYYNTLTAISLSDAAATFEEELAAPLLDLQISGRASLTAQIAAQDLDMDLSGQSTARLTGSVRYLTLAASTGEVDASGLAVTAARIEASNGAQVRLQVADRLEATTSTKATIRYKGTPAVLRCGTRFAGGTISAEE